MQDSAGECGCGYCTGHFHGLSPSRRARPQVSVPHRICNNARLRIRRQTSKCNGAACVSSQLMPDYPMLPCLYADPSSGEVELLELYARVLAQHISHQTNTLWEVGGWLGDGSHTRQGRTASWGVHGHVSAALAGGRPLRVKPSRWHWQAYWHGAHWCCACWHWWRLGPLAPGWQPRQRQALPSQSVCRNAPPCG